MEKALFLCSCVFFPQVSIDHLFDNLERGKKNIVLEKKLGKVLNFGSKICTNKQIINFEICYFQLFSFTEISLENFECGLGLKGLTTAYHDFLIGRQAMKRNSRIC